MKASVDVLTSPCRLNRAGTATSVVASGRLKVDLVRNVGVTERPNDQQNLGCQIQTLHG